MIIINPNVNQLILKRFIRRYGWVNSKNFLLRYKRLFIFYNPDEIQRFCVALEELIKIKDKLIRLTHNDQFITYETQNGLGSICITCVEDYVTNVLNKNGFIVKVIAKQFNYEKFVNIKPFPLIHSFNIVEICGTKFIVDIDADPFAGENTGILVIPGKSTLRVYNSGFIYHERVSDPSGVIKYFGFFYFTRLNKLYRYGYGNFANRISVVPYHDESEHNYCPIEITRNSTLFFSYDKCLINNKIVHKVKIYLTCLFSKERFDKYLRINIYEVRSFSILKNDNLKDNIVSFVKIILTSGRKYKIAISDYGTIVENRYFKYNHIKFINKDYGILDINDRYLMNIYNV